MNELSRLWRAANAKAVKQTGKEKSVVDQSCMFNLSDLDEEEEIYYVGDGQFSMIFRTTLVGSSNPVAVKVFYDSER